MFWRQRDTTDIVGLSMNERGFHRTLKSAASHAHRKPFFGGSPASHWFASSSACDAQARASKPSAWRRVWTSVWALSSTRQLEASALYLVQNALVDSLDTPLSEISSTDRRIRTLQAHAERLPYRSKTRRLVNATVKQLTAQPFGVGLSSYAYTKAQRHALSVTLNALGKEKPSRLFFWQRPLSDRVDLRNRQLDGVPFDTWHARIAEHKRLPWYHPKRAWLSLSYNLSEKKPLLEYAYAQRIVTLLHQSEANDDSLRAELDSEYSRLSQVTLSPTASRSKQSRLISQVSQTLLEGRSRFTRLTKTTPASNPQSPTDWMRHLIQAHVQKAQRFLQESYQQASNIMSQPDAVVLLSALQQHLKIQLAQLLENAETRYKKGQRLRFARQQGKKTKSATHTLTTEDIANYKRLLHEQHQLCAKEVDGFARQAQQLHYQQASPQALNTVLSTSSETAHEQINGALKSAHESHRDTVSRALTDAPCAQVVSVTKPQPSLAPARLLPNENQALLFLGFEAPADNTQLRDVVRRDFLTWLGTFSLESIHHDTLARSAVIELIKRGLKGFTENLPSANQSMYATAQLDYYDAWGRALNDRQCWYEQLATQCEQLPEAARITVLGLLEALYDTRDHQQKEAGPLVELMTRHHSYCRRLETTPLNGFEAVYGELRALQQTDLLKCGVAIRSTSGLVSLNAFISRAFYSEALLTSLSSIADKRRVTMTEEKASKYQLVTTDYDNPKDFMMMILQECMNQSEMEILIKSALVKLLRFIHKNPKKDFASTREFFLQSRELQNVRGLLHRLMRHFNLKYHPDKLPFEKPPTTDDDDCDGVLRGEQQKTYRTRVESLSEILSTMQYYHRLLEEELAVPKPVSRVKKLARRVADLFKTKQPHELPTQAQGCFGEAIRLTLNGDEKGFAKLLGIFIEISGEAQQDLNRHIESAQEIVDDRPRYFRLVEDTIEKGRMIVAKNRLIEDKNQQIEDRNQQIEDRNQQIEDRDQQIEDRNQQIEKNHKIIEAFKRERALLKAKQDNHDGDCVGFFSTNSASSGELSSPEITRGAPSLSSSFSEVQ